MALCSGPCLAVLRRREADGRLPEARVRRMVASMAENVVMDPTNEEPDRVRLLDLDLCRDLPGHNRCEAAVAASVAAVRGPGSASHVCAPEDDQVWGTAEYLAFEVLQDGESAYSPSSDWWALGVLSYELLYGKAPWSGPTVDAIFQRMSNHLPAFPEPGEGGPQVSSALQQLVRALLRHRPDMRLGTKGGAREVMNHAGLQARA